MFPQRSVQKIELDHVRCRCAGNTEYQAYKDPPILDFLVPFLVNNACYQLLIMSTYKHEGRDLDGLLNQLCRATANFQKDHNDLERAAASKAARKLVQALDKPQDAALLMVLSVGVFEGSVYRV